MKASDSVKQLMRDECSKDYNKMDQAFFCEHLAAVEKYALALAPATGADSELVSIASYIHDISAVRDFDAMAQHHILGGEIARQILSGLIDEAGVERIIEAVVLHNLPVKEGGAEAVVLSNADAMSKFDSPIYWISYAHKRKSCTFTEAVAWYRSLLDKTWSLMIPDAQQIISSRRDAVNELLSDGYFLRNDSL
jgi:putative nucleotidyltransferase with HDIG domain